MQQIIATTPARHTRFHPEYTPSAHTARRKAARPAPHTSPETSPVLPSHANTVGITEARTEANVARIEAEFRNNRRFYEHKLRGSGIAPHELPDALCEMFSLAIRWAGSYDANKSRISSWLGNQVVRTVASSIYGTRRPGWRHQQECEMSAEMLMNGVGHAYSAAAVDSLSNADTQTEDLAVAAFLSELSGELTPAEAAIIDICGADLLHERQALPQLIQVRDLLGVRSLATVRSFTRKLACKVRALALEHFNAQDLSGRPGFDKLAA
ncbi:hypothetical protein LMG23992_00364 [Cupriavidus laharis]|uniref:Sigma-70 family RNA polymerase sigma factor n=1 Tax=Cupriavidus laharis TaxID=151654 RepID=A0ABM8WDA1_9BURK|nr:hypothetical protein [Cupriavidus laharis]CAG9165220.1 hypothetical protein LMG23992_00364 [Cupriavidus laharis]